MKNSTNEATILLKTKKGTAKTNLKTNRKRTAFEREMRDKGAISNQLSAASHQRSPADGQLLIADR